FSTPSRSKLSKAARISPAGSYQKTSRCSSKWRRKGAWMRSLTFGLQAWDLLQGGAELGVVCLHAFIQVDLDAPLRQRKDHVTLPGVQLVELLGDACDLLQRPGALGLGGAGVIGQEFQSPALGLQLGDEGAQVV